MIARVKELFRSNCKCKNTMMQKYSISCNGQIQIQVQTLSQVKSRSFTGEILLYSSGRKVIYTHFQAVA